MSIPKVWNFDPNRWKHGFIHQYSWLEEYVVNYSGKAEGKEDPFEDELDASKQDGDDEGGGDVGDMEEK